jgi:hypothetical protein
MWFTQTYMSLVTASVHADHILIAPADREACHLCLGAAEACPSCRASMSGIADVCWSPYPQDLLYGLICMSAPPGELWMKNQDADQKRRSSYVWLFQVRRRWLMMCTHQHCQHTEATCVAAAMLPCALTSPPVIQGSGAVSEC